MRRPGRSTPQDPAAEGAEQSFLSHLIELRNRLMKAVIAVLLIFLALFPFANTLYTYLAGPLLRHMPEGSSMIAIDVASPFLTPFKLVMILALFLAMPFILYQAWAFVAPGLYRHEKRLAWPLLVSSILLFYLGTAFAYYVVFPLVFGFFTSVAPEGVAVMTDIGRYLDFVIKLFFAFGLAFEVPIATFILIAIGATTADSLARKRPYIIVGAFVVGMLLTPPDIISQVLLALPMWLLFELGLIFSRLLLGSPQEGAADGEADVAGAGAASGGGAAMFGDRYEVVEEPAGGARRAPGGGDGDSGPDGEEQGHRPLSEEEMEAELDRIEAEEAGEDDGGREDPGEGGPPQEEWREPPPPRR